MDWTEQQKEAITRRDSGLIVSAAAGSGKTSVLVERLLRILMDESPENKVPADHMIVVTFTNDAAAEMRSRLYQALDQKLQEQPENTWLYQQQIRLQNAHICTISSFCFELIRENLALTDLAEALGVGEPTLNDIVAELCKPGRDVRDSLPKPLLRSDVMGLDDLKPGMELTGTVRNVIDFGAFVDLGVHQDGLVHVSQISDKFIKHPREVLKVGDIVRVKVLNVDTAKKRIALTMKGVPQQN